MTSLNHQTVSDRVIKNISITTPKITFSKARNLILSIIKNYLREMFLVVVGSVSSVIDSEGMFPNITVSTRSL